MTQSKVRQMFIRANPGVRLPGRKGYWYRCAHCGKWCGRPGNEHANIQDYEKMVCVVIPFFQRNVIGRSNLYKYLF